ncbi:MAG: MurR/RpiR family transcriptional regulator [Siculibacillus sp.]|nr:MurR/RpiR family transcriptional regulator [Siculibacillus sp.]
MAGIEHAPRDFESLKAHLGAAHAGLPKRLRQVADFALAHPDEVALGTAAEVAAKSGVQPSTLVRLAQTIGYAGFSDMQKVFRARLREGWPDYHERLEALKAVGPEPHPALHLHGFARAASASLDRLGATMDPARLGAAVDLLAVADTIHLVGARRVFPVTAYLAYAFAKMGVRSQLVDNVGGLGGEQIAAARPGDAVLAVSYAPYAQATVDLVTGAAAAGVPVVAITDSTFSPLARAAGVWLEVAEADYGDFRSLAATFALAMALAVSVGEKRDAGRS